MDDIMKAKLYITAEAMELDPEISARFSLNNVDAILIALHDIMPRIRDLEDYLESLPIGKDDEMKIGWIFNSKAFNEGRLPRLEKFLPKKI